MTKIRHAPRKTLPAAAIADGRENNMRKQQPNMGIYRKSGGVFPPPLQTGNRPDGGTPAEIIWRAAAQTARTEHNLRQYSARHGPGIHAASGG